MPELSILDERLAEIDRRLRTIQSGLEAPEPGSDVVDGPDLAEAPESEFGSGLAFADGDEPLEPLPPPTPLRAAPAAVDEPVAVLARLHDLQDAHERLLELHRELLSQYAEILRLRAHEAVHAGATVTAGPFSDAAGVREFERSLSALPGVSGVSIREYLGSDRVALDVHLAAR